MQTLGCACSFQPCLSRNRSGLRSHAGAWERTKSRRGTACCARLPWARRSTRIHCNRFPCVISTAGRNITMWNKNRCIVVLLLETTETQWGQGKTPCRRDACGPMSMPPPSFVQGDWIPCHSRVGGNFAGMAKGRAREWTGHGTPCPLDVGVRLRLATTAQTEGMVRPGAVFSVNESGIFFIFAVISAYWQVKLVPVFWKNQCWRG